MRTAIGVVLATAILSAANNHKEFEKSWVGRHVIVRAPLYSLVYKERGIRGTIDARRDGLTVITPSAGMYFQFDGRRSVSDIVEHDVQQIAPLVAVAYRKNKVLDEGFNQLIEPVMIARYEPGTELVVLSAHVMLDRVRIDLTMPDDGTHELATALTVQWPAPLSKSFTERSNIELLILKFLSAMPV
jgi:hypothetical protein